jgi:hypothetical protein
MPSKNRFFSGRSWTGKSASPGDDLPPEVKKASQGISRMGKEVLFAEWLEKQKEKRHNSRQRKLQSHWATDRWAKTPLAL